HGKKRVRLHLPVAVPSVGDNWEFTADEKKEPSANFLEGQLLLIAAWSEKMLGDPILGPFVMPEMLSTQRRRGDSYMTKFLYFMAEVWAASLLKEASEEDAAQTSLQIS